MFRIDSQIKGLEDQKRMNLTRTLFMNFTLNMNIYSFRKKNQSNLTVWKKLTIPAFFHIADWDFILFLLILVILDLYLWKMALTHREKQ